MKLKTIILIVTILILSGCYSFGPKKDRVVGLVPVEESAGRRYNGAVVLGFRF